MWWLGLLACAAAVAASFTEELLLRPLASGNVHVRAHFRARGEPHLPAALAQLARAHRLDEALLTLTQGRWQTDRWGVPLEPAPVRPSASLSRHAHSDALCRRSGPSWRCGLPSAMRRWRRRAGTPPPAR